MTSYEQLIPRVAAGRARRASLRSSHLGAGWSVLGSWGAHVVLLGIVAAAVGFAVVVGLGSAPRPVPAFLQLQMGRPLASAPAVRHPAAGVVVQLGRRTGFAMRVASASVSLTTTAAAGGRWQQHAAGAVRLTPFGSEAVVLGARQSEQFLTVTRRQGPTTWSWRLDSSLGWPRVGDDGYVAFVDDRHRIRQDLLLPPVAILDGKGHDVTPSGLRWRVARDGAGRWYLQLPLDDATLPVPYVIDPATLRGAQQVGGGAGVASFTIPMPAGLVANDTLVAAAFFKHGVGSVTGIAISGGSNTWVPDKSFTTSGAGSSKNGAVLMSKKAGSSESGGSYTVTATFASGATGDGSGIVSAFQGWYTNDLASSGTPSWTVSATTRTISSVGTNCLGTVAGAACTFTPSGSIGNDNAFAVWKVDSENVLLYKAGTTYTVYTRGVNGTTAAAHANGATLSFVSALQANSVVTTNPNDLVVAMWANDTKASSGPQFGLSDAVLGAETGQATAAFGGTTGGTTAIDIAYWTQATIGRTVAAGSGSIYTTAGLGMTAGGSPLAWQVAYSPDPAAPSSAIATPASGTDFSPATYTTAWSGTASDPPLAGGQAGSGVASVAITLRRSSDGSYWNAGTSSWQVGSVANAATGTTSWTFAGPPTANLTSGVTYTVTSSATDNAGNVGAGTASTFVYHGTAPTAGAVSSPTADGVYRAGAQIDVTVAFSEAVIVTGTPRLTLATGGANTAVDYLSGSGSATLTFRYTVRAGDLSADLDYVATDALALNGGTIKNATSDDAVLTLAAPGAAGSLGASKAIVVDAVAPTVTSVTSSTADGTRTAGDTVDVSVTFAEAVTVDPTGGTPSITLNTTPSRAATYSSGSGSTVLHFSYLVLAGDTSSDLDYAATTSLAPNGGTIRDGAGNDAVLTLPAPGAAGSLGGSKNIVIASAPTVTSVGSSTADGAYRAGQAIDVSIAFSTAVTVVGTPQLQLETGASDRLADCAAATAVTTVRCTYTVVAGDISSDLDYVGTTSLSLNGGTIKDAVTATPASLDLPAAGGPASIAGQKAIVVDTTSPTGSIDYLDGYSRAASVVVTTSSSDPGGSGVFLTTIKRDDADLTTGDGVCGAFPGTFTTTIAASPDSGVSTGHCYRYELVVEDNAHNIATIAATGGAVVKLDTVAPVNAFSLAAVGTVGGLPVASYRGTGSVIFYRGAHGGATQTFEIEARVTDTASGGGAITTSSFAGAGGITHAPGSSSVPGANVFDSPVFGVPGTATGVNTVDVRTTDRAGNDSSTTSFTIRDDSTAPAGGALTVNGGVADAGGTVTTTSPTGSFAIGARTDYGEVPSATESGIATSTLTRQEAPLSGTACAGGFGAVETIAGTAAQSGLASGCYLYTLTGRDAVGNAASISTIVRVGSAPSAVGATVAGATVAISVSESLAGTTPAASAFSVVGAASGSHAVGDVTVSGTTVTLALSVGVSAGEAVTVSYVQPAANGLRSPSGNLMAGFTLAATNGTVATNSGESGTAATNGASLRPASLASALTGAGTGSCESGGVFFFTSAAVNGSIASLVFCRALDEVAAPPVTAFRVIGSFHGMLTPTSVSISGSTVTLRLPRAVFGGEIVIVSYARPVSSPVRDLLGNEALSVLGAFAENATAAPPVAAPSPAAAPTLVSSSPNDGLTIPTISRITLVASKSVTWTNVTVIGFDGRATLLAGGSGSSISDPFAPSGTGLYEIRATISDGVNPPVDVLSFFTIATQPRGTAAGGAAHAAERVAATSKVAESGKGGAISAADGSSVVSWAPGSFGESTVVELKPLPVVSGSAAGGGAAGTGAPPAVSAVYGSGSAAVDLTGTRRSDGSAVRLFGAPVDIQFPHAPAAAVPSYSRDGLAWIAIPRVAAGPPVLASGQLDGYYRDAAGTIHILSRHLTYFGALVTGAGAPLVTRVVVAPRLYLGARRTLSVYVQVSRRAVLRAGLYRGRTELTSWPAVPIALPGASVRHFLLPPRAELGGPLTLRVQLTVGRTVRTLQRPIVFLTAPAVPHGRPIVALVNGPDARRVLSAELEKSFAVSYYATNLDVIPTLGSAAAHIAAIVVDLTRQPVKHEGRYGLIRNIHSLFPNVKILVVTNNRRLGASVLEAGADAVLAAPATAAAIARALTPLVATT